MRILIVGSGITGSLISRYLSKNHSTPLAITIYDKARRPGGRFCTNRKDWNVDDSAMSELGAQYVSKSTDIADEELYEELLRTKQFVKLPASSIRGLHNTAIDMDHYEAPEGLSSVARNLVASESELYFSRHVSAIIQDEEDWRVKYHDHNDKESTTSEAFDKIVLTPPAPQVVDLLRNSDLHVPKALNEVKYSSRFAVALYPEDPSSFLRPNWSCAYTKGERLVFARFHPRSIVLHASVPFTMSNYEESQDKIVSMLSSDFKEYMGWSELPRFSHVKCHRWRYSQTSGISKDKGAMEILPGLLIAGDGIWGSNFDRCSKSARDAVELLDLDNEVSSSHRSSL